MNCKICGGKMLMSDGWVPSYSDPDNAGMAPEAEPFCPKCEADFERENLRNYEPMSRSGTCASNPATPAQPSLGNAGME